MKGELWCWGGSPQSVRAAHARVNYLPPFTSPDCPTEAPPDTPVSSEAAVVDASIDAYPSIAPICSQTSSPQEPPVHVPSFTDHYLQLRRVETRNVIGHIVQVLY